MSAMLYLERKNNWVEQHFWTMYLAFHLAVAPRQDDGGGDGFFVAKQSVTESVDFR